MAGQNQGQTRLLPAGFEAAAGQPPAKRQRLDDGGAPAPARAPTAAERARNAALEGARAIVAEGRPDLGKMYSEAMAQVDLNNRYNQSSLLKSEDRHTESVDFAAIDKDYDRQMARYDKAKGIVDAAAKPAPTPAQAAAFKAEVQAEAHVLALRALNAEVSEAKDIVKQGPVSYNQVLGWAQAEADQNYMKVGGHRVDHDAVVRDYDGINKRFKAAEQLLERLKKPLTSEEAEARIDAQMAEAERRVRQGQEGAGQGR
jgi:hypothetical protein